jgi:NitT/TauT family transport system ATP-binding protein
MSSLLTVDAISKTFDVGGRSIPAIDRISLDIQAGEFLSVLGPSGCGKSTVLQIISGLMNPSSGGVTFDGRRITSTPRGMVYLFQQYNKSLFAWRSVLRNVAFALETRGGTSAGDKRQKCLDYLAKVGLAGYENHYPWQLSGGMQQRVAIARALAAEPRVLLMDEPFSAVDALTRLELQNLILDIWQEQKLTVILVTHDVDEAIFMADRVAMLTARPSVISSITDVPLPRPRDPVATRESPVFLELRRKLLDVLLTKPGVPATSDAHV